MCETKVKPLHCSLSQFPKAKTLMAVIQSGEKNVSKYFWSETNMNATRMGQYLTQMEWRFIRNALGRYGFPAAVLDIGGGDGRFAVRLSTLGVRTTVLERDPVPIRELVARGWGEPVVLGDGNHLPFENGSFDAVMAIEVPLCNDTLHFSSFLESVHRVLIPKGRLLLTTRNQASLIGLRRQFHSSRYRHADYTQSYWKTRRILCQTRYDIVEAHGFRWIPGNRKSNNRLIPFWGHIERLLMLERLPQLSPWVFWIARKSDEG